MTWSALLVGALLTAGPQVQLQSLSGNLSGELLSLSAERIEIQTKDGPKGCSPRDLVRLDFGNQIEDAVKSKMEVRLVDGTALNVSSYLVSKNQATVDLVGGGSCRLDANQVAFVRLQPMELGFTKQLDEILKLPAGEDVLVIRRSEALDHLKGIIGDVTAERVSFTFGERVVPVNREKAFGLRYFQKAGRKLASPMCYLIDNHGSRIQVTDVSLSGDAQDELKATTPAGVELTFPIARVLRLQGVVEYLSDRKPLSVKMEPYLPAGDPELSRVLPRQDQNLKGGKLQLGKRTYQKGLSIHSETTLVYHLGGEYRRLLAEAGIDEVVGASGDAELIIRGDQRQLFAGRLRGTDDDPVVIDLDLSGVQRLTIIVGYGADHEIGDHVDLCNARIIK
ncbi:MAG: NPCBM/NEW2 domain-containing protein [Planctomycetales bacterium]